MRFALICVLAIHGCIAATTEDLFQAIRSGDSGALKLLSKQVDVNKADARGSTPLHYAAAFGNSDSVRILLAAGADVKARNGFDATPLILAAPSPEKVALLLEAGADPKAATRSGITALHIATRNGSGIDGVRRLLDAGADPNAATETGATPFLNSTMYGTRAMMELLLARGADARAVDKAGFNALMGSAVLRDAELVRMLVKKGANVNAANVFGGKVRHGEIGLKKMTPLVLAAPHSSLEVVRALLDAGAKVNVRDDRGMTPLIAAVAAPYTDPRKIRALLDAGADPNADDGRGESVLDWAMKYGDPSTLKMLSAAGAKQKAARVAGPVPADRPAMTAAAAVEKAVALLQKSSSEFFSQSGCIGCHHQPVIARAEQVARNARIHVGDAAKQEHMRSLTAARPLEPVLLQFMDPGGDTDTVATVLVGAEAAGIPANSFTDAAVRYLAGSQSADGSWSVVGISRVPMEDSDITRTALAIKALRAYGWPARQEEFDKRIAQARTWLTRAEPRNAYERADRLLGLYWAGAPAAELKRAAAALLREQRKDGGWAQTYHVPSDAYATGLALHALRESEQLRVSDAAYRRGAEYLLKTQLPDGSWYVRSRSPKFQPYFQSGFPHEHDQWISSTATAYAVMGLAPASGASVSARR